MIGTSRESYGSVAADETRLVIDPISAPILAYTRNTRYLSYASIRLRDVGG